MTIHYHHYIGNQTGLDLACVSPSGLTPVSIAMLPLLFEESFILSGTKRWSRLILLLFLPPAVVQELGIFPRSSDAVENKGKSLYLCSSYRAIHPCFLTAFIKFVLFLKMCLYLNLRFTLCICIMWNLGLRGYDFQMVLFVENTLRNQATGTRSIHYYRDITVSKSFQQIELGNLQMCVWWSASFSQLRGTPLHGRIRVHAILHHLGFSQLSAITNHVAMKNLFFSISIIFQWQMSQNEITNWKVKKKNTCQIFAKTVVLICIPTSNYESTDFLQSFQQNVSSYFNIFFAILLGDKLCRAVFISTNFKTKHILLCLRSMFVSFIVNCLWCFCSFFCRVFSFYVDGGLYPEKCLFLVVKLINLLFHLNFQLQFKNLYLCQVKERYTQVFL